MMPQFVKFFIAEACGLITVTEPYDIKKILISYDLLIFMLTLIIKYADIDDTLAFKFVAAGGG